MLLNAWLWENQQLKLQRIFRISFFLKCSDMTLPFLSSYILHIELHNITVSVCADSSLLCLVCGCSCCECGKISGKVRTCSSRGPEGSQRFHFHIMSPRSHKPFHKIDMFTYNMFRCSFLLCFFRLQHQWCCLSMPGLSCCTYTFSFMQHKHTKAKIWLQCLKTPSAIYTNICVAIWAPCCTKCSA